MYDSKRAIAVVVAVLTVVGFAVAPAAVVAQDVGGLDGDQVTNATDQVATGTSPVTDVTDQVTNVTGSTSGQADHGPFPHEICTDLMGMLHDEAPYDMIVWVDDMPESVPRDVPQKDQLPEQIRPPGVPWSVLTPRAVGGIVVGATPTQCDIQDPNDPSYDPIQDSEDNLAPDGGADVQRNGTSDVLFIVNGTLDETSEGPSGVAEAGLELTENGTIDPNTRLNDGEKDYGVDPQLKYWSDGTTYFDTDVYVIGTTVGGEMDCWGEECNFATRGLPNFVDYPAIPAPTDSERPDGGGDGSDESSDSTDGDGGSDDADDGPTVDQTSDSDDGTADSSDDGGGTDDSSNDGSGDDGSGDDSSDGSGASSDDTDGDGGDGQQGTNTDANQQQQTSGDDGNQNAEQAGFGSGKGIGILVALVVFVLGAGAIVPRD